MKTKTYNNENLAAYLLGALPEAEAEIFDELSFTDDDFAGELGAAEKDLVDAYVNGELKGEKLEKFEAFYLASPRRREKVEFAAAFQNFAEKKPAENPVAAVQATPERGLAAMFSSIFSVRRPVLQWGFALAALVFMILGGWLFRENSRLRLETSEAQAKRDELLKRESELAAREKQLRDELANRQTADSGTGKELAKVREEREKPEQELKNRALPEQPPQRRERLDARRVETQKTPVSAPNRSLGIASFILAPPLRGNGRLQTVSIPPKTDSVAMRLELEADDYKAYRVALKDPAGARNLWQSGRLKSKSNGSGRALSVGFPAALLKSQIYSLEVSGVAADGTTEIIGDYSFRVVR